jgi:hypothetical protein
MPGHNPAQFSLVPSDIVENIVARLVDLEDRRHAAMTAKFLLRAVETTNITICLRRRFLTGEVVPQEAQVLSRCLRGRTKRLRVDQDVPSRFSMRALDIAADHSLALDIQFANAFPVYPGSRSFENVRSLDVRIAPSNCHFPQLQRLVVRDVLANEDNAHRFVTQHAATLEDLHISSVPNDTCFPRLLSFSGFYLLQDIPGSLPKLEDIELCHHMWSTPTEAAAPALRNIRITEPSSLIGHQPATIAFREHAGVQKLELSVDAKTTAYATLLASFNFPNLRDLRVNGEQPCDAALRHMRHFPRIEHLFIDKSHSPRLVAKVLERVILRLKSICICPHDPDDLEYVRSNNARGLCPFALAGSRKCGTLEDKRTCISDGRVMCVFR